MSGNINRDKPKKTSVTAEYITNDEMHMLIMLAVKVVYIAAKIDHKWSLLCLLNFSCK